MNDECTFILDIISLSEFLGIQTDVEAKLIMIHEHRDLVIKHLLQIFAAICQHFRAHNFFTKPDFSFIKNFISTNKILIYNR